LVACSEQIRAAKGNPVTANELLVLLGRAWSRLLIYPGGLAAFGVIWLIGTLQKRKPRTTQRIPDRAPKTGESEHQRPATEVASPKGHLEPAADRPPARTEPPHPSAQADGRRNALEARFQSQAQKPDREPDRLSGSWFWVLSSIVPPWLTLALLPLPLAVTLPRQIDIVIALTLLEWPNLLMIRRDLRANDMRRLAAALNSYPPLLLATLALAQAGNSLELAALARAPGDLATTSTAALHWLGAIALALALPPALGIGPFAGNRRPTTDDRRPMTDDRRPTTDVEAFSQSPIPNPQPPDRATAARAGAGDAGGATVGWRGGYRTRAFAHTRGSSADRGAAMGL
jgi:hypothetical protein